jgi:hypothetical protein
MQELARLAQPYYHRFARGGEGHLEVAKNIYYTVHKKAHMVLSLKPFGCMPSSQSDRRPVRGDESLQGHDLPAIETSGEGEINAHSRVQMALGKRRPKPRPNSSKRSRQPASAWTMCGISSPSIRNYGIRSTACPIEKESLARPRTFVLHVSDLIDRRRPQFAFARAQRAALGGGGEVSDAVANFRRHGCRFDHVKAVAVDPATDQMIWSDYQRHETKQPEKTLEFLGRLEADLGINSDNCRMFITGSGGGNLAQLIGAKFVQEVTAVSLAVEKLHPEVHSVIELGGQDAKIIVFKPDPETGRKKKIPVDERQVRRRHRRGHRQDQREVEDSRGGTVRTGLSRDQAAQGRRQVRGLR